MGIIAAPELIPLDSSRKSQEPSGFLALCVSGLAVLEQRLSASGVPTQTQMSAFFFVVRRGELR